MTKPKRALDVAYLCDGKKEQCEGSAGCYWQNYGECKWTSDISHARNFIPVHIDDTIMRYAEKDRFDSVSYEYHLVSETEDECKEIATSFHNKLVGNLDYVENRIIVNCDANELTLTVFYDSVTKVRVQNDSRGFPKLVLWDK